MSEKSGFENFLTKIKILLHFNLIITKIKNLNFVEKFPNLDFSSNQPICFLDYIIRNAVINFLNNLKSYLDYILTCLKVDLILNYLR